MFPVFNTQYILIPNCHIRQGVSGVVYFDFTNESEIGYFRFFVFVQQFHYI